MHSVTTGETATFSVRPKVERGEPGWSNYVRGVIAGFQQAGKKVPGFDAVIESTLPYGGGLASSAALEVATATLLEAMTGQALDPIEKALLCQRAEHDFAGVPCGIMDQFTSILGRENHALLLDCRSRTTTPVPMTDPGGDGADHQHQHPPQAGGKRIRQATGALRNGGARPQVAALRDATPEALDAAQKQMEPVVFRRARHVITENERTLQAARAIQASDWPAVGQLMYASHASLRDDYEVSCPELDTVVEIAQAMGEAGGIIGCRMTGGGFGGCAVSLVKTDAVQRITRKLDEAYEKKTGKQTSIFSSRPAAGARVLKAS